MVPAPGDFAVRNPVPTPLSKAPFLGGWGTPRVVLRPPPPPPVQKVAVSAAGYITLVEAEYARLIASQELSHELPEFLFSYVMCLAWWKRALFVKSKDGLTHSERAAFSALQCVQDDFVPDRITDWLVRMGHFDGVQGWKVVFDFPDFSGFSKVLGISGFVSSPSLRVVEESIPHYMHLPVPGVFWGSVLRNWDRLRRHTTPDDYLGDIRPHPTVFSKASKVSETPGLVGWTNPCGFKNRVKTLRLLRGAGICGVDDRLGHDLSTDWLVSPSIVTYVGGLTRAFSSAPRGWIQFLSEGSITQLARVDVDERVALMERHSRQPIPKALSLHFPVRTHVPVSVPESELNFCVGAAYRWNVELDGEGFSPSLPWIGVRGDGLRGLQHPDRFTSHPLITSLRAMPGPTLIAEAVTRFHLLMEI